MTMQEILDGYRAGTIAFSEVSNLLKRAWEKAGLTPEQGVSAWNALVSGNPAAVPTGTTKAPPGTLLPELVNPFGAYQRGLASAGLNAGLGGGEFGNWLQERFRPTSSVFSAQSLLGKRPSGANVDSPFAQYAMNTRGGSDVGAAAQASLRAFLNAIEGKEVTPQMMAFTNPRNAEQYAMGLDLARESARQNMGGYAARLLPSDEDLLAQFRMGDEATNPQAFLPWLKKQFGLQFS